MRMANASEWELRVATWRASGLRSEEFCKGRGYSPKSLLWWSSRLRHKRVGKASKRGHVQLAKVIRTPATPPTATVLIEIEGARIAVGSGASTETLCAVFDALRSRTGSAP
jgi:hypothetical protein